jgi:hypothetical protein
MVYSIEMTEADDQYNYRAVILFVYYVSSNSQFTRRSVRELSCEDLLGDTDSHAILELADKTQSAADKLPFTGNPLYKTWSTWLITWLSDFPFFQA